MDNICMLHMINMYIACISAVMTQRIQKIMKFVKEFLRYGEDGRAMIMKSE